MKKKTLRIGFIFLIATSAFFFGLMGFRDAGSSFSMFENRRLAKLPALSLIQKDSFPEAFEHWQADHFAFRNVFLNGMMGFTIQVMKQSPIPEYVVIGKDNWLYNTGHEIDVYRGTNRFSQAELDQIRKEILIRKAFIESQSAHILFAVSPLKYSVYPEYVPVSVNRVNDSSRTDQFIECLTVAGVPVVDLRKALQKAKKDGNPLFYKSDNHWNHNGAFVAYQALMKAMKNMEPGVGEPLQKSDYTIKTKPGMIGNLGKMLYLKEEDSDLKYTYTRKTPHQTRIDTNEIYTAPKGFNYAKSYEERFTNGNKKSPKILIIRDSFGEYPSSFLKEHFSETVCIFDAWEYKLNPDIIKQEKPDIVLFMVLESFTHKLIPAP